MSRRQPRPPDTGLSPSPNPPGVGLEAAQPVSVTLDSSVIGLIQAEGSDAPPRGGRALLGRGCLEPRLVADDSGRPGTCPSTPPASGDPAALRRPRRPAGESLQEGASPRTRYAESIALGQPETLGRPIRAGNPRHGRPPHLCPTWSSSSKCGKRARPGVCVTTGALVGLVFERRGEANAGCAACEAREDEGRTSPSGIEVIVLLSGDRPGSSAREAGTCQTKWRAWVGQVNRRR